MQRKFAAFDIDGTLIRWQLYHAVVAELAKERFIDADAYTVVEKAYLDWKTRAHSNSFHDYERALLDMYLQAINSIAVDAFENAVKIVFDEHKDQIYTYTRDAIRNLKQQGYVLVAISGSQQEIVEMIGQYYGFDYVVGSRYTIEDGHYTNKEYSPAVHGKDSALKKVVEDNDLTYAGSFAFGDTRSDIAMLELVENPIAFNPNNVLFEYAKTQGWKVVIERKNMIYELDYNGTAYVLA